MTPYIHLHHLRRLACTRRYHTEHFIGENTVRHHSSCVALILMATVPACSMNLLQAALLHDLEEGETGDIPAPTKMICRDISRLEQAVRNFYDIESPKLTDIEILQLRAADFLDNAFICRDQRMMGNQFIDWVFDKYLKYSKDVFNEAAVSDPGLNAMKGVWLQLRNDYRHLAQGENPPLLNDTPSFDFSKYDNEQV